MVAVSMLLTQMLFVIKNEKQKFLKTLYENTWKYLNPAHNSIIIVCILTIFKESYVQEFKLTFVYMYTIYQAVYINTYSTYVNDNKNI
jgi:hypothetical protein